MTKSAGKKKTKKSLPKSKPKTGDQKPNPFDLKFNRTKHNVLGKDREQPVGKPFQSRKRALENRERTLAKEYKSVGKVNKIVDKRWGERNANLTAEEKASKRFAEERMNSMKKGGKFNLNEEEDGGEDEQLTHGGRALTDIQRHDRIMADSDEEDEGVGEEFASAHFGGGGGEGEEGRPRDRKEVIAEMILASKQRKKEKRDATEAAADTVEDMDERFASLLQRGAIVKKERGAAAGERSAQDEYDKAYLSLKLSVDKRSQATDARKTREEEAEEERRRLEKMESDRLMRANTKANATHYSVDDDSIERTSKRGRETSEFVLKYDKDGRVVEEGKKKRTSDDGDEGGSEEEDEEQELEEMGGEEEEEGVEEEEEEEPVTKKRRTGEKKGRGRAAAKIGLGDLPFTFEFPRKYEGFKELIEGVEVECIQPLFERLAKCHHPSLKEGNKAKLEKLFLYALRYFTETARLVPSKEHIGRIEALTLPLHNLLKLSREPAVKCVRALLRGEWRAIDRISSSSSSSSTSFPSFVLPSAIRLVAALFPVTDVWHPVCTPAYLVATRCLTCVRLRSLSLLGRQLLLLSALSDFVDDSHRFIPEAVAFLRGSLALAVTGPHDKPPSTAFPVSLPHAEMLLVKEKVPDAALQPLAPEEIYDNNKSLPSTDANRCRLLRIVVVLLKKFMLVYASHPSSFAALFRPLHALLLRLPLSLYPCVLAEEVADLTTSMAANIERLSTITQLGKPKTEQSMLPMMEPRFEEGFDPEHAYKTKKYRNEGGAQRKKLQHLIKKERRGAIKEIRKDTAFIASKRSAERAGLDRERKRKTKRLMASLQSQEGDAKREDSRKKWKKR